jgi:hypothetical protein
MMIADSSWRLRVLIWTVGFALVSVPGLAATTSSCTPFLPEMIPGVRLRFPYEPFDPQLGTLDEAVVSVQGRLFGQVLIGNPSGGASVPYAFTITHELAADLGRSFTFLGADRARFEFSGQSAPLVPFGYSREFSYRFRCDTMSNLDGFCPLVDTPGVDNVLVGMSASLIGFTDDGVSVAWQVFVDTGFEPSGFEIPVNIAPDLVFGAEGDTCVEYVFTVPEPHESLGSLVALLTLGGLAARARTWRHLPRRRSNYSPNEKSNSPVSLTSTTTRPPPFNRPGAGRYASAEA